ncbi:helix-turn-helix domain-containing protein [Microlunatus sp. Y2014]|uniref:helix-turn-helix domain-containing protein n=1 Tax=Microlunatus sp. Y2014 TaxID=3418488 RepID=UPI003DA77D01
MSVDTQVDTFGSRLKDLRLRARLSQSEAGGERYSGSYISHLESGRRLPNDDVIRYLADRLGVKDDELFGADRRSYAVGSTDLSLLEADAAVREAERNGDPAELNARAEVASAMAAKSQRADIWWHAVRCQMHARAAMGEFAAAGELGDELLRHPITQGSARLQVEILSHMARSRRARGQLVQASDLAERAVELSTEPGVTPNVRAEALMSQISTMMDIGQASAVTTPMAQLREIRSEVIGAQVLGQVAWVLGNLAFVAGETELGEREHATALELLKPEVDLNMWARLRQASARFRLEAGHPEGVADLIDAAALALSLVGNPGDLANLEMARAAHALAEHRPEEAILLCQGVLSEPTPLSPQSRAEVFELQHRALVALGDLVGARKALLDAATKYEEAGAWQRALAMWRMRAGLETETAEAP